MTDEEKRARRAAYMREYNKRPEANRKMRERSKKRYEQNKEAILAQQAEYRKEHPEVSREAQSRYRANPSNTIKRRYLKARYGLTIEQYEQMVRDQNGLCKICNGPPNGRYDRLHVDHSHQTDEVRGLLCFRCNAMLGHAQDDLKTLQAAIDYLSCYIKT